MPTPRLSYALETGGLDLPPGGRVLLLEPPLGLADIGALSTGVVVEHNGLIEFDHYAARGIDTTREAKGPFDAVVVFLPRARELARGLIARAAQLAPGGVVIVDGNKSDGADAMLKAVRPLVPVEGQVSKAHGRTFWFRASGAFADWALKGPSRNGEGWVTQAGVFSADGIDPGSRLLAEALPDKMKGRVADLGGGWGYLTHHILTRQGVTGVDLVEADARALDCAKLNTNDARIVFHWADATAWGKAGQVEWVVMNPPFHSSRAAEPGLGQAFIQNAARVLTPSGQLLMVANRHLPYEQVLNASFASVQELTGTGKFKILRAAKPVRRKR